MNKYIEKVKLKFSKIIDTCGSYAFTFYVLMIAAILVSVFLGYMTRGESIQNMLFCNPGDTFMDYFNSIQYGRNPYERGVIYPPLMNVIYAFFGHFVSYEDLQTYGTEYIRSTQMGLVSYFAFLFITLMLLFSVIKKVYSNSEKENILFCVVITFSIPFLFAIERGNSIILCLDFLMIFYYFYDSDNKLLKHIALLSLGIATAMKIYVVIFGCLLLREKKWKDAIWCCIYGAICFFAPFLLMAGESRSFIRLIKNIFGTVSDFSNMGYGYKINISNALSILSKATDLDFNVLSSPIIFLIIFTLVLTFFNKHIEKWKFTCMLSLFLICVPGFSFTYTIIFLLIPLIDFLKLMRSEKNIKISNIVYLMFFIVLFIPLSISDNGYLDDFIYSKHNYLTWNTIIEIIILYSMFIMLSAESVYKFMKNMSIKKKILTAIPFLGVFSLLVVQLCTLDNISNNPNARLDTINGFSISKDTYTQIELYLDDSSNTFCFPAVPRFTEFEKNELAEISLVNWHSAVNKKNLGAFELGEQNKPDVLLVSTKSSYSRDDYNSYRKELYEFGYMYDYLNIGVFGTDSEDSFELWLKKSDAKSKVFNQDYGTDEKPYILNGKEQFLEFAEKVNNGWNFADRFLTLTSDIDLSGINWIPIGNYEKGYAFSGNFNGKGHIIYNLNINKDQRIKNAGLFDFMNGIIYNLGLLDGSIVGQNCGSFAAYSTSPESYIINCFSNISMEGSDCGAFAGKFSGRIECCYYNGTINADKKRSLAFDNGNLCITDCFVNKNIAEYNGMEKINLEYFNNYLVDEDFFYTDEFANTINSTLINRGFFGIQLLKYEYDPAKNVVSHSSQWTYEFDTSSFYVTALVENSEEKTASEDDKRLYSIVVDPHCMQFGPYYPLEKGKYKVTYYGENLNDSEFDVHSHKLEYTAEIDMNVQTDTFVEYTVTLPFDIEDVEFRAQNNSDNTAYIYNIYISSME